MHLNLFPPIKRTFVSSIPPSLTSRISLNRKLNLPSMEDFGSSFNILNDLNSPSKNNPTATTTAATLETIPLSASIKEELYKGRRITVGYSTEVNIINDLYDPRSFKRSNKWTDQNRAISLATSIIKNENIYTEKRDRSRNVYPHLIKNKKNIEKRKKKFMDMRSMIIDEILDLQNKYQ